MTGREVKNDDARFWHLADNPTAPAFVRRLSASLIGRSGSSTFKPSTTTFQTIHHCSVDVARGLVLLFGIGARALPLWDSRTRRNNLLGGLTVRLMAGPSGHAAARVHHPSRQCGGDMAACGAGAAAGDACGR